MKVTKTGIAKTISDLLSDHEPPMTIRDLAQKTGIGETKLKTVVGDCVDKAGYKRILNTDELAVELIKFLVKEYPGILTERYSIEEVENPTDVLMKIAESRNCLSKGNELDYSKAAILLIDDFRSGKLGKLTLEMPPEEA